MAQDTRKDPRGKVLSMTVRYKSATIDEFIEHHSHDVSSGGIFIKTSSPYPPGTLLKFEIRIQDELAVLSGVGRVVWKREPDASTSDSPAGMGVKFIKIDDKSKSLITRLVAAQGGGPSAYDAGKPAGSDDGAESEDGASIEGKGALGSPSATSKAEAAKRGGGTLLGIGAIGGAKAAVARPPAPAPEPKAVEAKKEESGGGGMFFPSTNPDKEQPPPEERTVMKQAAELLKQALAEAGGSLDDLGGPLPKDALLADEKKPEAKEPEKAVPKDQKLGDVIEKANEAEEKEAEKAKEAPKALALAPSSEEEIGRASCRERV